jgi:predicted NBD/HSP70 family sugar kinase
VTQPVLGVDLGGTHLRVAAADSGGLVYAEQTERVGALTTDAFARRIRQLVDELCPEGTSAVAVGLPAPVAADGTIGPLINLPGLSDAPLGTLLQETLAAPVVVENDVNLAALGEQRRGRSSAPEELVFIAVGTGVGMGIVIGGRIVRGAHGGAGELGALPLGPDRVGNSARTLGPLEAVAGGAGLAQQWAALTGRPSDGRDVYAAAEGGDSDAAALLDDQARALAMGVRAVQAVLDPDLFVFGGGIGARADVYARVHQALAAHGVPVPELALSALGERAGVLGAVEMALDTAGTAQTAGVSG